MKKSVAFVLASAIVIGAVLTGCKENTDPVDPETTIECHKLKTGSAEQKLCEKRVSGK